MSNYILLIQFNNPPLRFPVVKIQFFRKAGNRKHQMDGRGMYEHTTFSTSGFYFYLLLITEILGKSQKPRKSLIQVCCFRFFRLFQFLSVVDFPIASPLPSCCNQLRVSEHCFWLAKALLSACKSIAPSVQSQCSQRLKSLLPVSESIALGTSKHSSWHLKA